MNITSVGSATFGRLYLKNDNETKEVIRSFVKDKQDLDVFEKALNSLDGASGNHSVELSAEKEGHKFLFYLNKDDKRISYKTHIPDDSIKTTHARKNALSNLMTRLVTTCENIVEKIETSAKDDDIDACFSKYSK